MHSDQQSASSHGAQPHIQELRLMGYKTRLECCRYSHKDCQTPFDLKLFAQFICTNLKPIKECYRGRGTG